MKRRIVLLMAFVCVAFAIYSMATNNVDDVFGGPDNVAVLAAPDSVKAWRTAGPQPDQPASVDNFYRKSGAGITLPPALATHLSKVLRNRSNYPRDPSQHTKNCIPEPGIVVTFSKGDRNLDIFLCFECNIMIARERPHGNETSVRMLGYVDFDSGRDPILRIIKRIFPNDAKIQPLEE